VGLQVYELTGSTLSVGLVGLFALVPLVLLGLYGGAVADAHDRRTVVSATSIGLFLVSAVFAAQAWLELEQVGLLYGLVAAQNGLYAINSPARSAIIPRLLPTHLLPAANALATLAVGGSMTLGPLLAGALVSVAGYGWTYTIETVLLLVAVGTLLALPSMPPEGAVRRAGLASVLEGLRFLGTRPTVRMTFLIDLAAMVLAMPRVLFPAIGAVVLGGGATTVGVLFAGMAGGSTLAGLLSGPLGLVHRQGRAVVVSVVAWGAFVAAFGVVLWAAPDRHDTGTGVVGWTLVAATACMALAGAADTISSVFRQTILQSATPDAMRGRLQGVFIVVVAGGPRLGDLLLGAVADLSHEAFAAVAGGLACVAVALALAMTQPAFLRYDARHPAP
ncbi:MAG: major facilitator superfamily 1, partial [Actinotalea sp.]|nr:major facilitator superfamily 1 [Actinotalea sp.]